jgi:hypothetical protein
MAVSERRTTHMSTAKKTRRADFNWQLYLHAPFNVPVLDTHAFTEMLTVLPDRDERTKSLVRFLALLPGTDVPRAATCSMDRVTMLFARAMSTDWHSYTILATDSQVVQLKHEDYVFATGTVHLLIQLGNQLNDISDYFQRTNRMACGGYDRLSPATAWAAREEKCLTGLIGCMWRLCSKNRITLGDYQAATRLSATVYTAAQFKVHAAIAVYRYFDASSVIDFSMGWGDRLAGWFAACASKPTASFFGCDPNTAVFNTYQTQITTYRTLLEADALTNNVHLRHSAAEDVDWSSFVPDNSIDLVFTSPPYADTERYGQGTTDESKQSWARYGAGEQWFVGFMEPVLRAVIPKIRQGGHLAINIIDPEKHGTRFRVCDRIHALCASLGLVYTGYIGMRMKQRPRPWSGVAKATFMAAIVVEPIWCFQKPMLRA